MERARDPAPTVALRTWTWPWVLAWSLLGVLALVGLAGALTIGVFVLPLVAVGAVVLAGLMARRAARRSRTMAVAAGPTPPGAGPRPRSRNALATISLVRGIASMVVSPPLAVVGLVTGVLARGEIRRSGGTQTGAGQALAGMITSVAGVAIAATLITVVLRH